MKLHHFGIATSNIEKSSKIYRKLGFEPEGSVVYDEVRNIDILFMKNESTKIELIRSHDLSKKSPIDRVLNKQGTDSVYHSCYESDDYNNEIEELLQEGFVLIDGSKPAIAFGNKNVCFLYSSIIGMIELLEKEMG